MAQKVQPLPREYQITEANQQTMSIPTPPSPPTASQSVLRRTNFTLSYGSLNTSRRFTRARSKKIRGLVRENATCFVPALAAMRRCRILRLRLCVTRCTPQPHLSNIYSCDYTAMHEGSTPPPPFPCRVQPFLVVFCRSRLTQICWRKPSSFPPSDGVRKTLIALPPQPMQTAVV